MEEQKSNKKYAKISAKRRKHLIQLVQEKGMPVARAASRLNLKLSTAKHILKTFKEKGYVYEKKMIKQKQKHNEDSTSKQPQEKEQQKEEQKVKRQNAAEEMIKIQPEDRIEPPYHFGSIFPNYYGQNFNFPCIPVFWMLGQKQNYN